MYIAQNPFLHKQDPYHDYVYICQVYWYRYGRSGFYLFASTIYMNTNKQFLVFVKFNLF